MDDSLVVGGSNDVGPGNTLIREFLSLIDAEEITRGAAVITNIRDAVRACKDRVVCYENQEVYYENERMTTLNTDGTSYI